jgi:hypothetical protein
MMPDLQLATWVDGSAIRKSIFPERMQKSETLKSFFESLHHPENEMDIRD